MSEHDKLHRVLEPPVVFLRDRSVLIHKPAEPPALLQVGEGLRFLDRSEWVVYRVGISSAGVRCIKGTPGGVELREVEFAGGRKLKVERKTRPGAYRVGERLEISPRSLVERIRVGP